MFSPVDKDTAPNYVAINSSPNSQKQAEEQVGELAGLPVKDTKLTPLEDQMIEHFTSCVETLKLSATTALFAGLMLGGYTLAVCTPIGILAGYQLYRYHQYHTQMDKKEANVQSPNR